MAENVNFTKELSERLTEQIGYPLRAENVIHDHPGIEGYVTELKPGYPVMIVLGRTSEAGHSLLTLIMAEEDYHRLEKNEINVDQYINESYFHYGYFKNGGQLTDIYWRPLENDPGIHDTARVNRYLRQLNCYEQRRLLRHCRISSDMCAECALATESCPYPSLDLADGVASEILGPDRRKNLFDAVHNRVVKELGFDVYTLGAHHEAKNELHLYAGSEPNSAIVHVSWTLINEMLYRPDIEHNWQDLVDSLKLVCRLHRDPEIHFEIDLGTIEKHLVCIMFWADEFVLPQKKSAPKDELGDEYEKDSYWKNFLQAFRELLDQMYAKIFPRH